MCSSCETDVGYEDPETVEVVSADHVYYESVNGYTQLDAIMDGAQEMWLCPLCSSYNDPDDTASEYWSCDNCGEHYDDESEAVTCCISLCNGEDPDMECECGTLLVGSPYASNDPPGSTRRWVLDAVHTHYWICLKCHKNTDSSPDITRGNHVCNPKPGYPEEIFSESWMDAYRRLAAQEYEVGVASDDCEPCKKVCCVIHRTHHPEEHRLCWA